MKDSGFTILKYTRVNVERFPHLGASPSAATELRVVVSYGWKMFWRAVW
jgi:hypothetical protein